VSDIEAALDVVLRARTDSGKPLGIVLAGHNGSGKSTLWRKHLSNRLRVPLVNADRMMLSILPEAPLPKWAVELRDSNESWMRLTQKGVESFVAQAMLNGVPFAMETVFSYWAPNADGTIHSKIDLISQMQTAGYFVLLAFVGLSSADLSVARVATRIAEGGHSVPTDKLLKRFGRTQRAVREATKVADATVLFDNSFEPEKAFSICRIELRDKEVFDIRSLGAQPPTILTWLEIVSPRRAAG
jgi:predicted ABC-type ATPase